MATHLDPITYEVIRNGLLAGAAEMKVHVMRSSYATLWREAGDLSCAILNDRAELIAQGPADIPMHLATMPFCLEGMLKKIPPSAYEEGDVLFQNDPMWGNNHLPDCVTAKPVFVDGEIIAYTVVRGHWTDIGGIGPGRYSSSGQCSSVCSDIMRCFSRTSSSMSGAVGRSSRTSTGRMNLLACATTSSSNASFSRLKQFT